MQSLIPTEHWDYSFSDLARGLFTSLSGRDRRTIEIPGLGSCETIRSARAGIVVALRALGLPAGASIGVPLYCCSVVFKAIESAGYHARFIDVDPDTYCMSATDLADKSSAVDAVIAVHMFGNLCDMPALRAAAPGKPFIEDCAQALGSRVGDRLAGSLGEVAAFSFRSGKYLSVGEGGALYTSQVDLQSRLSQLIGELEVPSRMNECIHVVKTYLRSLLRSKPLWGVVGSRLWEAYSENVSFKSQSPLVLTQIHEGDRSLAVTRLAKLGSFIERQRRNANYYSRNLTVDADMLCSETPGVYLNRLQYPVRASSSEQCEQLTASLRADQISTARPYKDIAAMATKHYGYTGDCPISERVAKTVLVIPCNYALKEDDVERITNCVNRAWAQLRDCHRVSEAARQRTVTVSAQHGHEAANVVELHHP